MSGRQTRHKEPVNYSTKALEKEALDLVPFWAKSAAPSSQQHNGGKENDGKENEREPEAKKSGKRAGDKVAEGKKASRSAPTRGRQQGVTVVPIIDRKQHKNGAKAKRALDQALPLSAADFAGEASGSQQERQLVTKDVPGLPFVKQKRLEPRAAPEAEAPAAAEAAAAVQQPAKRPLPSAGSGKPGSGKQKRDSPAEAGQQLEGPPRQPGPKRLKTTKSGSKSAELGTEQEQEQLPEKAAPEAAPEAAGPSAAPAAAAAAARRLRRPSAPPALAQPGDDNPRAAALRAASEAAKAAGPIAAEAGCERCQGFSDNFAALLGEYQALQREYEALKAARLNEDVEELLQEHNKKVTEHGAKAAELVALWKDEAEQWQQRAEGTEALHRRNQELERELLTAQEALLERQAVLQQREALIRELEARNQLLERRVRIPEVADRDVQTHALEAHSAGVQATSAPAPSLQPSGVQMCEARAMAPEGADLQGTVYKPARPAAARSPHSGAGATDPTYTMPGTTYAPALAARLAAAAAGEQAEGTVAQQAQQQQGSVQQQAQPEGTAATAAGTSVQQQAQQPTGDSDMLLTGEGLEQLQPVSGRLAHAAGHAGGRVAPARAPRRASLAPSPLPSQRGQQQAQQQAPASAQRRASVEPTAESLMHAVEQMALPHPAAQARARRASAPPAPGIAGSFTAGVAPLERQLLFASASLGANNLAVGHMNLAAVPEEGEEAGGVGEEAALLAEGQAQTEGQGRTASVPPPPREGAVVMIGFEATPCKGGKYIYSDPPTGFVFELGPAAPGIPDSSDDEDAGMEELSYRPLQLGSVGDALPAFLRKAITFEPRYKHKLMAILMGALAEAGPQQGGV